MTRLPVSPFLLLLVVSCVAGLRWAGFFYLAAAAVVLIAIAVTQEWWAVLTGRESIFGSGSRHRP